MMKRGLKWVGPVALLLVGVVIGWWYNQPSPSWMQFDALEAYYKIGAREITTDGQYTVRRECRPEEIWRYEAIATDGQIAIYGPRPPAPSFSRGEHKYTGSIPLLEKINPDGWVVRILITCPGEFPETITSGPARVQIVR